MPSKQNERVWLGGAVVVGLLMLLVGYFAFIAPQRSQTRDVEAQVSAAKAQNAILSSKIETLDAQRKHLAKYEADLAQARLALPSTSGLPDFLRTLQSIGAATGADASLTVAAPTDVTSLSGATETASGLTVGSAHIYALPITAQVTGTVAQLNHFLTQLQSVQPRAVLISEINETASSTAGSRQSSLSLTMQAFVAPSSSAEDAQLAQAAQK